MKLCKHENVLTLYNCFTVKSSLWLIMPFMNMGSCLEVMKQLKLKGVMELKEEWISAILSGAVEGMAYLHKSGWIHRDIKSGNILIDNEANVVLADFGVAAITKKAGTDGSEDSSQEFRNTFAGTPCWMAPEVMKQAKGYSEKADIWSLGITTLELAKGYAPYARERTMKVLLRTLQEDPPSLETYVLSLSLSLSLSFTHTRILTKIKNRYEEQGDTGKKAKDFSRDFQKFYKRLLQKEPSKRPNAKDILKERFLTKCKNPKAILMKELLPNLVKLTGEVVEDTDDGTVSTGAPDPTATSGILDASLLGWVDPSKTGNKMFTHAQKAMKDGQAEQHKAVTSKFKDAFEDDDDDDDDE